MASTSFFEATVKIFQCGGNTAAHLAAYRRDLTSLVHLYRYDPKVIHDVDIGGYTPFRILYQEFLRLAFNGHQFNRDYPGSLLTMFLFLFYFFLVVASLLRFAILDNVQIL